MLDSSNFSCLCHQIFFCCDKNINVQFSSLKWSFYNQTMLVYAHSMFAFKLYTYACSVKKLFSLIDEMSIVNTICLNGVMVYLLTLFTNMVYLL